jgi:hypothetical protein
MTHFQVLSADGVPTQIGYWDVLKFEGLLNDFDEMTSKMLFMICDPKITEED